jgi:hypothetical protein
MDINILMIILAILASWITILAFMCLDLEQIPDKNLIQNEKRDLHRVTN